MQGRLPSKVVSLHWFKEPMATFPRNGGMRINRFRTGSPGPHALQNLAHQGARPLDFWKCQDAKDLFPFAMGDNGSGSTQDSQVL